MQTDGQTAVNLALAAISGESLPLILTGIAVAAMIYLIASFAIEKARTRDDRRSGGGQRR